MSNPSRISDLHRLGRVHHVAVIVRDLEAALGFYRDILGLPARDGACRSRRTG